MKKLILISVICFLVSPAMADENVCGPGDDGYLVWINCPDTSSYEPDGQLVEALTRKRVSGDEIVEYDKNRMIKHIRKIRQELEKIEIIIRRGD